MSGDHQLFIGRYHEELHRRAVGRDDGSRIDSANFGDDDDPALMVRM
jgi:hypothetical protein